MLTKGLEREPEANHLPVTASPAETSLVTSEEIKYPGFGFEREAEHYGSRWQLLQRLENAASKVPELWGKFGFGSELCSSDPLIGVAWVGFWTLFK